MADCSGSSTMGLAAPLVAGVGPIETTSPLTSRFNVATLSMRIVFDPRKDGSNLTKHGVSLRLAAELDWERALVWPDDRRQYGEMRVIALAPKATALYYVAFVDRGAVRRVIGLRRANRREARHYVRVTQEDPDRAS